MTPETHDLIDALGRLWASVRDLAWELLPYVVILAVIAWLALQ